MKKLKVIRDALKLKQDEFATRLGIGQSYLSAMETDKKPITNKLANILFKEMNVSPEWFYNDSGNIFNIAVGNSERVNDGENLQKIDDNVRNAVNKKLDSLKNKIIKQSTDLNSSNIDQVDTFLNASIMRDNYEDYTFRFYDFLKENNPTLYKTVSDIKALPAIERALSKINQEFSFLHNPFFSFAHQGKTDLTYKEYLDFMFDNLSKSETRLKSLNTLIKTLTKVQEQLEKEI